MEIIEFDSRTCWQSLYLWKINDHFPTIYTETGRQLGYVISDPVFTHQQHTEENFIGSCNFWTMKRRRQTFPINGFLWFYCRLWCLMTLYIDLYVKLVCTKRAGLFNFQTGDFFHLFSKWIVAIGTNLIFTLYISNNHYGHFAANWKGKQSFQLTWKNIVCSKIIESFFLMPAVVA